MDHVNNLVIEEKLKLLFFLWCDVNIIASLRSISLISFFWDGNCGLIKEPAR